MPEFDRYRQELLSIFQAALTAANGERCVRDYLLAHNMDPPVYLIAIGKAAASMAAGAQAALGTQIRDACIVTKYGHGGHLPWPVHEAGHPLPDGNSLLAGERLFAFIDSIPGDARVLVLLSGGASSLVERIPAGLDLSRLQQLNHWLLASGLDIARINRVRRQLSGIKGGRLAKALAPRSVTCLVISDVAGNDLPSIGGGPLAPPADIGHDDPALPDYVAGVIADPPPPADDPCFTTVRHIVIADLDTAKTAAADAARKLGYQVHVDTRFLTGDAVEAGGRLAAVLAQAAPGQLFVWGGEPTVHLPAQPGQGGRSQQLALAAARGLAGTTGRLLLAAGTDGSDGPGGDAGALVDGRTLKRARLHGFDAGEALARADAGRLLEASGDLLQTGPTGTNVNDLYLGMTWEED